MTYIDIIAVIFLLIFIGTMNYHGIMIIRQKHGYSLRDYLKQDSTNMRKRIEELLKNK